MALDANTHIDEPEIAARMNEPSAGAIPVVVDNVLASDEQLDGKVSEEDCEEEWSDDELGADASVIDLEDDQESIQSYESVEHGYDKIPEILETRLLRGILKVNGHMTDSLFDAVNRLFPGRWESWATTKKYLHEFGITPTKIECCPTLCVAYVSEYANLQSCPVCHTKRNLTSPSVFWYFSIVERLRKEWMSPQRAESFYYRAEAIKAKEGADNSTNDVLEDFYDGSYYKLLSAEGYFKCDSDLVLAIAADGAQIFKEKVLLCADCLLEIVLTVPLR